jgi:hypothetical protein
VGNLFAVFGNAELSNKMASYTADHEVLHSKTFYSSDGFCADVERKCRRHLSVLGEPPPRDAEQKVCDTHAKGRCWRSTGGANMKPNKK